MEKENLKYSDFAFGTNFLIYQRIYHFTLNFKPIYGNENFQKISIKFRFYFDGITFQKS